MLNKKKKIFLILGIIIITAAVLLFTIYRNQERQTKVQKYLEKQVGANYANNFALISTRMGTNQAPYADGNIQYYEYEFLPFTRKHTYTITIGFDTQEKYVQETELPPCVYLEGEERCLFLVTYSEAYDKALARFTDGNITVTLTEDENVFRWRAQNTIGDPLCQPLYKFFFIDVETGEETSIEEKQDGSCV